MKQLDQESITSPRYAVGPARQPDLIGAQKRHQTEFRVEYFNGIDGGFN